MSTLTFDLTNAAVTAAGSWRYGYITSQRCLICGGSNSAFYFTATGTDCAITWAVANTATNYFQVSVDGGAFTNLTLPGAINTWTSATVFTGLTDTAHTVVIQHVTGSVNFSYFQVLAGISVTGAAPAISQTSGMGTLYNIALRDFGTQILYEGAQSNDNFQSYPNSVVMGGTTNISSLGALVDGAIRFKGNPTSISLWAYLDGYTLTVWQDGVRLGNTTLANTSKWGFVSVASGLDGATHEYVIEASKSSSASPLIVFQLMLIGGTLNATGPTTRPHIVWVGDSITMGLGTGDSSVAHPMQIGMAKGYATQNLGVSGIAMIAYSSSTAELDGGNIGYYSRTIDAANVGYVVVNAGHNDGTQGGSATELQNAYQRMFTLLKAAYPNATYLAIGVFPTNATFSLARSSVNTAMQNAAGAVSGWTYVSTDTLWGTGGTGPGVGTAPTSTQITSNTTDGTHPTSSGYAAVVSYLSGSFTSYSPSGGGTTGVPMSRVFTGS